MTTYRIRDWSKHFENNRTRELKELRFVILPNKHDGDGYTELLDHPNGAAHYGAWIALVQVASRGQHPAGGCGKVAGCCECRGILLRDGQRSHDPASLARITRIPEKVFKDALPRLIQIGWMEQLNQETQQDSYIPQGSAEPEIAESRRGVRESAAPIEQNGMEENRREEKEERAQAPDSLPFSGEEFLQALAAYDKTAKQRKVKTSPDQRRLLFEKLLSWGERSATLALKDTVANGWRGVFEPKNGNGDGTNQPGTYQTAAERRNAATVRNLERAKQLRSGGNGTVDPLLRRESS
jgi:hypothetical protein